MIIDLVNEIHYFLSYDTFSSNTSLNQKYNDRIILKNKLSILSNDNFFIKNKK